MLDFWFGATILALKKKSFPHKKLNDVYLKKIFKDVCNFS